MKCYYNLYVSEALDSQKEGILDNHYYEDESGKPKNETKIR